MISKTKKKMLSRKPEPEYSSDSEATLDSDEEVIH